MKQIWIPAHQNKNALKADVGLNKAFEKYHLFSGGKKRHLAKNAMSKQGPVATFATKKSKGETLKKGYCISLK